MDILTFFFHEDFTRFTERILTQHLRPLYEEEDGYWSMCLSFYYGVIKNINQRSNETFLGKLEHEIVPVLQSTSRADVDIPTPLLLICLKADSHQHDSHAAALKMAEKLIRGGANVNCSFWSSDLTPIVIAVSKNDRSLSHLLLKNGANPSTEIYPMKITPLFLATVNKNASIFDMLLRFGSNINHRDVDGNSVLIVACAVASDVIVKIILSQNHVDKIDVNARNKRRCTALHAAVFGRDRDTVNLLLDFGAEVNAETVEGCTPLDIAQILGRNDIKELLVERGGSPKFFMEKILNEKPQEFTPTLYGNLTPLHVAASRNSVNDIEYYLKRGVDINGQDLLGRTPLHVAIKKEAMDAAALLLSLGADPNVHDSRGFTPIFIATWLGYEDLVTLLLSHVADTDAQQTTAGLSLLHAAARNNEDNSKRIAKMLIRRYAPFDKKDDKGNKPLIWAIAKESNGVVETLKLQKQLFSCIKRADLKELDCCVKKGAIINCRSVKFKTPLQYAVVKGNPKVVDCLINHGADVTYALPEGVTALHYAAKFNQSRIVLKLLLSGSPFNAVTVKTGKTPLDLCEEDDTGPTRRLLRFVRSAFSLAELGLSDSKDVLRLISRARNSNGQTVCSVIREGNKK